jgi:CheY-like chemotaxis protein
MVIDDEPDIYDVLVAMFRLWGIEGIAFVDGSEAVQWVESVDNGTYTGELPEMAIIDIRLPGVDGHYVAARIRRSPRLGNMAIALITTYRISPAIEKQIMAIAQADAFIEKPLPSMAELRAQLDSIIAKRKAMAPNYPGLTRPAPREAGQSEVAAPVHAVAPSAHDSVTIPQMERSNAEIKPQARPPVSRRTDA